MPITDRGTGITVRYTLDGEQGMMEFFVVGEDQFWARGQLEEIKRMIQRAGGSVDFVSIAPAERTLSTATTYSVYL